MKLTRFDINNMHNINQNTGLTRFQESIANNDKDLFFSFMTFSGLDIKPHQIVAGKHSLLDYSYINAALHDDFTIFEFFLEKDVDKSLICDEIKLIFAIQENDVQTFENIISDCEFRDSFNLNEKRMQQQPLFNIIRYALDCPEIFEIYKKYELPLISSNNDALFFLHLFRKITDENFEQAEKILLYLIENLNFNPCLLYHTKERDYTHCGIFSFIYEYTNSLDNNYSPVKIFEILNSSPYFDINMFKPDSEGDYFNLLHYTYLYVDLEHTSKKIIIDLIKEHKDLNKGFIDRIDYSPIMLSMLYNESEFFEQCLPYIDYTYKNKNGDNLLAHFLKADYESDFYYMLTSSDLFFKLIKHIIEQFRINNIDFISALPEAIHSFQNKACEFVHNNFTNSTAEEVINKVSQIPVICETAILKQFIPEKENNKQNKIKKRI